MDGKIDDILHKPFRVFGILSPLRRFDVRKLGGPSVGINAGLEKVLDEEKLVGGRYGEEPEGSVLRLVPWAVDACLDQLILCHEVLPHVVVELVAVKPLHAIVNESRH